ncbi:hypothetical protein BDQ17DRAFT_1442915 [Cyathus striatus]|nr:hypothetical protein BDQ17DRAFT_1442915 [Cyathus striatus]
MSSPTGHVPHYIPWYNRPSQDLPITFVKKISSIKFKSESFRSIAPFPWNLDSAVTLWDGQPGEHQLYVEPDLSRWKQMLLEFSDAVAIGSQDKLFIFFAKQKREPIRANLPLVRSRLETSPTDCVNVAWILGQYAPFEPLVVFNRGSVTYIYNVKRKGIASYLRGHGGAITSIAVHPTRPNLFCTTSRDTSVRIYDLALAPQKKPQNPHWPPSKQPSLAGAAHGLHMSESEGSGLGRCIIVLMGGRSGGHRGAVLGALDRTVKIWLVPPVSRTNIKGEDKPLFSCSRIHKARILSVSWLQNDVLATHSAAAVMRAHPSGDGKNSQTHIVPGEFIVWRWLGIDRFLPPNQEETRQVPLRGCSSDYQESSSFKIISAMSFTPVESQFIAPKLNIFRSSVHDPLAVYTIPGSSSFSIFNVCHMPSGKQSSSSPKESAVSESNGGSLGLNDEPPENTCSTRISLEKLQDLSIHPPVTERKWNLEKVISQTEGRLENCTFAMGGSVLIGVGTEGTVWVWRLNKNIDSNVL